MTLTYKERQVLTDWIGSLADTPVNITTNKASSDAIRRVCEAVVEGIMRGMWRTVVVYSLFPNWTSSLWYVKGPFRAVQFFPKNNITGDATVIVQEITSCDGASGRKRHNIPFSAIDFLHPIFKDFTEV